MAEMPYGLQSGGAIAVPQNRVLRNTYLLLAISLIPTVIGAMVGMQFNILPRGMMGFIIMIAAFYGFIWAIERNRDNSLGVVLMLAFTFFLGVVLGPLLSFVLRLGNGPQLVGLAAGGTAAVFFAMAGIATTSKRDFGSMGKFLVAGVIVAMVLVVANAFFQSPAMHLAILAIFIPLSSMLILFHVNQVVRGGETNYISAALSIYIAVYNLFSSLLQILGIFGGSDD